MQNIEEKEIIEKILKNKNPIIIFGETASGKTSLSIKIAKMIDGEIINCDIPQSYSKIKIGTAAPSEEEKENIKHHLFNEFNFKEEINAYAYSEKIEILCEQILKKNKIPIIVGGSHFYVYSLFFKPDKIFKELKNKNSLKIKLPFEYDKSKKYSEKEKAEIFKILEENCPEKSKKININDVYRLFKAIDGINNECVDELKLKNKFEYFLIKKYSKNNENNILKRALKMLNDGWINEFEKLSKDDKDFIIYKKIIGYEEIKKFLNNEINRDELIKLICIKTRQYAKKQRKFIKKMEKDFLQNKIDWLSLY